MDHLLRTCPKFLKMNPDERFLKVKQNNLCINCLNDGHKLNTCQSNFSCLTCKQKHHTLLHREVSRSSPVDNYGGLSTTNADAQSTNGHSCFATASKHILLGTAIVNIVHRGGVYSARALIDSGSQATFISDKLQKTLNLPVQKVNAKISCLNDTFAGSVQRQCSFVLTSPLNRQFKLEVNGLVLPKLTGKLPNQSVDISDSKLLDIQLADPNFAMSGQVDLLIGGDVYSQIMLDGVKRNILGKLMAQESIFGWILTGPLSERNHKAFTTYVSCYTKVSRHKRYRKFIKKGIKIGDMVAVRENDLPENKWH